jgi:hypothetical protein
LEKRNPGSSGTLVAVVLRSDDGLKENLLEWEL